MGGLEVYEVLLFNSLSSKLDLSCFRSRLFFLKMNQQAKVNSVNAFVKIKKAL